MSNKQSSVDWLIEEITVHLNYDQRLYFRKIIEQAKAMHKEEIETAFDKGADIGVDIGSNHDWHEGHNRGYHYYNETFGGEQCQKTK